MLRQNLKSYFDCTLLSRFLEKREGRSVKPNLTKYLSRDLLDPPKTKFQSPTKTSNLSLSSVRSEVS